MAEAEMGLRSGSAPPLKVRAIKRLIRNLHQRLRPVSRSRPLSRTKSPYCSAQFPAVRRVNLYTDNSFPDVPAHSDSRHQSVDSFDGGCPVLRIIPKDDIPKYDLDRLASDGSVTLTPETSGPLLGRAGCPLCHTEISSASARFPWQCRKCGQRWSPRRLAAVAAYATWVQARERRRDHATSPDQTETLHPLPVAV